MMGKPKKKTQIAELESQLAIEQARCARLADQNDELAWGVKYRDEVLDEQDAKIEELLNTISSLQDNLNAMQISLTCAEAERDAAMQLAGRPEEGGDGQVAMGERSALERQVAELSEQLDESKAELASLNEELSRKAAAVDELQGSADSERKAANEAIESAIRWKAALDAEKDRAAKMTVIVFNLLGTIRQNTPLPDDFDQKMFEAGLGMMRR